MHISRRQLWKADFNNVVRLAKFLGLHGCSCSKIACRIQVIDDVAFMLAMGESSA